MKKIILILFVISVLIFNVSAIGFVYNDVTAIEKSFNKFEVNFTANKNLGCNNIINYINSSGELSTNIMMDSCTVEIINNVGHFTITGHLKDYNIKYNKLFNPWFNTSYDARESYIVYNACLYCVMRLETSWNKSDVWTLDDGTTLLNFWNYSNNLVYINLSFDDSPRTIYKYINNSNYYTSSSSMVNTFINSFSSENNNTYIEYDANNHIIRDAENFRIVLSNVNRNEEARVFNIVNSSLLYGNFTVEYEENYSNFIEFCAVLMGDGNHKAKDIYNFISGSHTSTGIPYSAKKKNGVYDSSSGSAMILNTQYYSKIDRIGGNSIYSIYTDQSRSVLHTSATVLLAPTTPLNYSYLWNSYGDTVNQAGSGIIKYFWIRKYTSIEPFAIYTDTELKYSEEHNFYFTHENMLYNIYNSNLNFKTYLEDNIINFKVNDSVFLYTDKSFYRINKNNGSIDHRIMIDNISDIILVNNTYIIKTENYFSVYSYDNDLIYKYYGKSNNIKGEI